VRIGGQAGIADSSLKRIALCALTAACAAAPAARRRLQLLRDLARILRGQGADLEIEAAIGGTMFSALPPLITPVCTVLNGGSKRAS
jgi:predicted Zn-dependent protease